MSGRADNSQTEACAHLHCRHDDNHHDGDHVAPASSISSLSPVPVPDHAPEEPFSRVVGFMDVAGVFASTLCTIHCLLLPVVFMLLPVFAAGCSRCDYVHVGLAGFVLSFCLMAYIPGYLKHHDRRLIWLGTAGISLVFFATFVARQWGELPEATIITAGNAFIIWGHILNRRLLAHLKCKHN